MLDSFKAWVSANHMDVILTGLAVFVMPTILQVVVKPPPGSKAAALVGALSAWGFDAEKFARKLGELLAKSGGAPLLCIALLVGCKPADVAREAELVLHAVDTACGAVALLHDDAASAVCLVVGELDDLDRHLESAEAAQRDAPLVVVAKDGSKRKVRVRREHVSRARRSVQVARVEVSP